MIDGQYDVEDDEENGDNEVEKKKKTTDYGKIAVALGRFKTFGIKVMPPNINKSSYTFTPNEKDNAINYGFSAIARISADVSRQIIECRPYNSLLDFINKIKLSKIQMLNLIKAGCFDEIEKISREQIMMNYLRAITNIKTNVTLQNMQSLIDNDLIPSSLDICRRAFQFNKYLTKFKVDDKYELPEDKMVNFITSLGAADNIIDGKYIYKKTWEKVYKNVMDPLRNYLSTHKNEIINQLNYNELKDIYDKNCAGNISHWEMESMCYYYHEHELANANLPIEQFDDMEEIPTPVSMITSRSTGASIPIYDLKCIAGTVINKDKIKNTVSLLTESGVVNVKIYKEQFANYDRQISVKDEDTGKKKVLEKSWFTRGSLLLVQGIRRGDAFIPKKYSKSIYPIITKIENINKDGDCELIYNRIGGDEN